eukprot:Nk52_evm9s2118 gene=Nk52_evmTU9s2118
MGSSDHFARLWVEIGAFHQRTGAPNLASEAFASALQIDPVNYEALVGLGEVLSQTGHFEEAEKKFQKALNGKGQNDALLWAKVAMCKLRAGCGKETVTTCLNRGLAELKNARDGEFWYCMGVMYQYHHEYHLAAETFIQVLAWPEENAEDNGPEVKNQATKRRKERRDDIYFHLGVVLTNVERFKEAEKCFQYLLEKYFAFKEVGKGLRPALCCPYFPEGVTLDELHSEMGLVKERSGHRSEALKYYLDALQINRGIIEGLLRQIQSSGNVHVNTSVSPVEMHLPRVLCHLGWLFHTASFQEYSDIEQYHLSICLLRRSVPCFEGQDTRHKRGRGLSLAWYLLGRVFCAHGVFDEAYEAYHRAISADESNPLFWCSYGTMCFEVSKRCVDNPAEQDYYSKMTLEAYSNALRLDNRMGEVWYNLGLLYALKQQVKDAQSCLQKAIACGADKYLALRALSRIQMDSSESTQSSSAAGSMSDLRIIETTEPLEVETSTFFKHGDFQEHQRNSHRKIPSLVSPSSSTLSSRHGSSSSLNITSSSLGASNAFKAELKKKSVFGLPRKATKIQCDATHSLQPKLLKKKNHSKKIPLFGDRLPSSTPSKGSKSPSSTQDEKKQGQSPTESYGNMSQANENPHPRNDKAIVSTIDLQPVNNKTISNANSASDIYGEKLAYYKAVTTSTGSPDNVRSDSDNKSTNHKTIHHLHPHLIPRPRHNDADTPTPPLVIPSHSNTSSISNIPLASASSTSSSEIYNNTNQKLNQPQPTGSK